jgi:adenylate cyclase
VRPEWLEDPTREPVSTIPPREIVRRFLEREIERRPSTLSKVGLSTLQLLSAPRSDDEQGTPTPLGVVFTDLSGFTAFTAAEGDEAASEVVAANGRAASPIVRSRGGRIVRRLGDGFLVSFPTPEGAVLGSLELVDAVREPLPMRAGAHWGEPLLTRDDVIGHDVNVAARVADVAKGGEVLVTAALRAEAGDLPGVRFGPLQTRTAKGIPDPVQVCRARTAR